MMATKTKTPAGESAEVFNAKHRENNQGVSMMNATAQPPALQIRTCILYVKDGQEQRTPWFTCRDRAHRALRIVRRRYGSAVIYRD